MILIILFLIVVIGSVFLIVYSIRAIKQSSDIFRAKYEKYVGQEIWMDPLLPDVVFDEGHNIVPDMKEVSLAHKCYGPLPEFFPCKITSVENSYKMNTSAVFKVVPLEFEADFIIKYVSKRVAIFYSKKYGELVLPESEYKLFDTLKDWPAPHIRLRNLIIPIPDSDIAAYRQFDRLIRWEPVK